MNQTLFQATCDPQCSFSVKSHDRAEVVAITKEHGKRAHNLDMPDAEVEKSVVEISE